MHLAPISSRIADSAQLLPMLELPSLAPSASLGPSLSQMPASLARSSSLTVTPATMSTGPAIPALLDFTGSTVEPPARLALLSSLVVQFAPRLMMLAQPSPAHNALLTLTSRETLALLAICWFKIALPAMPSTTPAIPVRLETTGRLAELNANLVED